MHRKGVVQIVQLMRRVTDSMMFCPAVRTLRNLLTLGILTTFSPACSGGHSEHYSCQRDVWSCVGTRHTFGVIRGTKFGKVSLLGWSNFCLSLPVLIEYILGRTSLTRSLHLSLFTSFKWGGDRFPCHKPQTDIAMYRLNRPTG